MHINVEIYDQDGRMIDLYKVSAATNVVDIVNINYQDDKFIITPIIPMNVTKIKHNGFAVLGKENHAQFQSTYPSIEVIKDKPFYWLKLYDFLILKPVSKTKLNNNEIDAIIITCDDN